MYCGLQMSIILRIKSSVKNTDLLRTSNGCIGVDQNDYAVMISDPQFAVAATNHRALVS